MARTSLVLAIGLLCNAQSLAQTPLSPTGSPLPTQQLSPPTEKRDPTWTATEAMERLKRANGRRAGQSTPGPAAHPAPDPKTAQRAAEALRARQAIPTPDARVSNALAAGQANLDAEHDVMMARLYEALGLEAPALKAFKPDRPTSAPTAWVPIVFASSSMPIATLRSYAIQLEHVGGVIAFRGMPGGMTHVGPMAALAAKVLRRDPGCEGPACAMRNVQIIVDPILFRQHGVARVPALAMVPGDPTLPYCEREEDSPRAAHLVYGDAALDGLLTEYARLGGKMEVRDAQARLAPR